MQRPQPNLTARFANARTLGPLLVCGLVAAISLGLGQPLLAVASGALGLAALGFSLRNSTAPGLSHAGASSNPPDHGAYEAAALETLQSVIGVLDQPAFTLDSRGTILSHNGAARDLFPSLEVGRLLHQVSRSPGLLDAFHRARENGNNQSCEIAEPASSGRRLLATLAPLKIVKSDTLIKSILIQFRDLSEQDRLARLRTDFIANASHELRTPLASIKGFIETLQGPASSDLVARKKFLVIMEAQAARMTRILDDLLSLGRIEMREHLPPAAIIDLATVLKATVEGMEPIAREARTTLNLEMVAGDNRVQGDRDELVQVFQNLIENAIKYGHDGGRVDVTLQRVPAEVGRPPRVKIDVSDDGPGIAAQHLPRLTERFYRVDTATSRERGGTGLGLAIVRHILNRHRGELKIASTLGKGSTFTVALEVAQPTAIERAQHGTPSQSDDWKTLLSDIND